MDKAAFQDQAFVHSVVLQPLIVAGTEIQEYRKVELVNHSYTWQAEAALSW